MVLVNARGRTPASILFKKRARHIAQIVYTPFARPYLMKSRKGSILGPSGLGAPRERPHQPHAGPEGSRAAFLHESSAMLSRLRLELFTDYDRDIWGLFLPALCALVLEPIQQVADTVIIGKL
jgi:hypothetical protein